MISEKPSHGHCPLDKGTRRKQNESARSLKKNKGRNKIMEKTMKANWGTELEAAKARTDDRGTAQGLPT